MVQIEIIIVGMVFLILGLFQILKPGIFLKIAKFKMKLIWKADFKYNKQSEKRVRIIGMIFTLIGLLVLYNHLILGRT
ncbi:MAG: hypothetical protein Q8Q04_03475 [archaeon]|nr:hypothetical protein [archaeon]